MKKISFLMVLLIMVSSVLSEETKDQLNGRLFTDVKAENLQKTKYLIKNGANVNAKDEKDLTPLFHACQKGNLQMVKLLVENGATWNKAVGWNGFPVFHAAVNAHKAVVDYFLSLGFDMNQEDLEGFTLFHWAACSQDQEFLDYLITKHKNSTISRSTREIDRSSKPDKTEPPYFEDEWEHKTALLNAIIKAHDDYKEWRKKNEIDSSLEKKRNLIKQSEIKIRIYKISLQQKRKNRNRKEEAELCSKIGTGRQSLTS